MAAYYVQISDIITGYTAPRGVMSVNRPYRRTCRQFVGDTYGGSGRWKYIQHPGYASAPEHFVRAFLMLQDDMQELFQYVEPADKNLQCHSYRIHSLLVRACIEVEANCKAILKENGYSKSSYMNMGDYSKIDKTHRLSSYEVKVPRWSGAENVRHPFSSWKSQDPLPWYQAYNSAKHNRHEEFENATFENMLDAICGLLVILSSQFWTHPFSPGETLLAVSTGHGDGMESAIGDYFRIKFPRDWPEEMKYDFDWSNLQEKEDDPFQEFDYFEL